MKMRSLIGLFVAAAFTAGSGAVHAIKLVTTADTHPGHKTAAGSTFTYAKETLLKSSGKTTDSGDLGDTTYVLQHHAPNTLYPGQLTSRGAGEIPSSSATSWETWFFRSLLLMRPSLSRQGWSTTDDPPLPNND